MSKDEILHSSRRFLYTIYSKYADRACENLGVPKGEETENDLPEEAYPSEFKKFSKQEREEYISQTTDEEFMRGFEGLMA